MNILYVSMLLLFVIAFIITVCAMIFGYRYQLLLTRISKKISDGYVIFTNNGKITNFNDAFLKLFDLNSVNIKRKNILDIFDSNIFSAKDIKKLNSSCEKVMSSNNKARFEIKRNSDNKIFKIEIMSIVNNDIFMRYVLIVKDVTKTYELIEELRSNQDLTANREKFAILGQLISGVVHSLKSPIFTITGQLEHTINLINEYEASVGDETVTLEDHYEIANDMSIWLNKMKNQVENISDSITAIRSQVVTLNNSDEESVFTIEELLKYIDILMKNTLKQYLIILNFTVRIKKTKEIKGNLNSLVQVISNLIMNSIDSYEGKPNQTIDIIIDEKNNKLEISVIDTGKGIPKNIQSKIFKEIITSTSSDKTGLGLLMSYSNIKAQFGGDIKFTSEEGNGSTFKIILPIK